MVYRIKITAESNGTIVIGKIFKNLIPDFCIFILPLCAESKRRFGVGVMHDKCICRCIAGDMSANVGYQLL